jgi:hypothetical protein
MHELFLLNFKNGAADVVKFPSGMLAGKPHEWYDNVRIAVNELPIEVTKTQEWLNILNFMRFRPVQNDLNLVLSHAEAIGGNNKPKVLNAVLVELTFLGRGVKSILVQSTENFLDVSLVLGHIFGIDEYIIKIDNNTNIKEITENIIHKMLKSCGSIGKSKWHDKPLKWAIVSMESGLPFFTVSDPNKMISVVEVDFGKQVGFLWGI